MYESPEAQHCAVRLDMQRGFGWAIMRGFQAGGKHSGLWFGMIAVSGVAGGLGGRESSAQARRRSGAEPVRESGEKQAMQETGGERGPSCCWLFRVYARAPVRV